MQDIKIVFFDTETTGLKEEDRILQIAYSVVSLKDLLNGVLFYKEEYIKPPVDISPSSAAIHGIWYQDIDDAKEFKNSNAITDFEKFIEDESVYFVAHNEIFDRNMLVKEDIFLPRKRTLDSLRLLKLFADEHSDCEKTSLQYFRYYFDFHSDKKKIFINDQGTLMSNQEIFKTLVKNYKVKNIVAHSALSDVIVLHMLFIVLLSVRYNFDFKKLYEDCFKPIFITRINFGKVFEHGTLFEDVACLNYVDSYGKQRNGLNYLNWVIKNMDTISLEDKVAISNAVINCLKNHKINNIIDSKPMIEFAATFLPEHWEYLTNYLEIDIEQTRNTKIKEIEDIISALLNSSDDKNHKRGLELKEIFNFLLVRVENYLY